jgi:hypothetical protein
MSNLFNLHLLPNNDDKRSYSKTKNTECIVCIKTNKKATQALKKLIKQNVINEFKRSNSFSPIKKIYDISVTESDIEKLIFGDWIKYNKEIDKKIGEQILKLLIDIFDKRYALYPNNICSLSEYSLQCQSKLNSICSKFKELSFYMLYKLYDQIIPFYKCLDQKLNFKTITPIEYEDIKEILYYISNDLSEIFKNPLENEEGEDEDEVDEDKYFKLSHILIVMLEDYLIKENKICDKLHLKTKSPLYKAKENFEKFLELINNIYFIKDYEKLLNERLSLVDEENIDKEDEKSSINIEDENKNDNDEETENNNEDKEENKDDKNLSIEDLVNFINEPKKNENKKKRKKKNKNKNKNKKIEITICKEEDIEFLNYKKDIEVYTQNLPYVKKIRPKYSENFLKTMKLLSQ